MEKTLEYVVPAAYDGDTVQNFLRRDCGLSWRMVVRLKHAENGIVVDGAHARSIDRVKAGQVVTLTMPEEQVKIEGVPMPLDIVYEDEYLLVVNKPPYLAVHPSAGKPEPTLANGVVAYYEQNGVSHSFRPVNRLDRNTSGLLLAGKNPHVVYALAGNVKKEYRAIVLGEMTENGTVDAPIRVKEGCTITREVGEGGKESVTHYEVLAHDGELSYLRVWLETGRTHQIRVHLSSLGFPLAGDTMYGTDETVMPRHALHCGKMEFVHPVTGKTVAVEAPIPEDMREVLKKHGFSG